MNADQRRLLLDVEYHFYRLGSSIEEFQRILVKLGYKPNPDISKLDDAGLMRLNKRLRVHLRSPLT